MRNLLLALLLLASPLLHSDEGRFDPPLKGAYLGVSLGKISAGLVVLKIEDNSAAQAAGLRRGDVLVVPEQDDWVDRRLAQRVADVAARVAHVEALVEALRAAADDDDVLAGDLLDAVGELAAPHAMTVLKGYS